MIAYVGEVNRKIVTGLEVINVAKDHKLFHRNGSALNRHFRVIKAAMPVLKALLNNGDVDKVNTAGSQHSHGQRSIKVRRTDTGLSVDVRGEGGRQVVYAVTSVPETVTRVLEQKFPELVIRD